MVLVIDLCLNQVSHFGPIGFDYGGNRSITTVGLMELIVLIEAQSLKFSSLILNFGVQVRNFEDILPDNNNL